MEGSINGVDGMKKNLDGMKKNLDGMKKNFSGVFKLHTGLFHLAQPDVYWEFDGELACWEDSANEYEEEARYELDIEQVQEYLAKRWVNLFSEWLRWSNVQVGCQYAGHWSPKEYNYRGDEGDFTAYCSPKEFDRLCKQAMGWGDEFEEWLYEAYRSYDGFISFYPDHLEEYVRCFNNEEKDGYEKALVIALQFLVFRGKEDEFRKSLHERVADNACLDDLLIKECV